MTATVPEPPNHTVLYWPETEDAFSVLAIRDDAVAALHDDPACHWTIPNTVDGPLTWDDLYTWCGEQGAPLADAVRLTAGGESA